MIMDENTYINVATNLKNVPMISTTLFSTLQQSKSEPCDSYGII